MPSKAEVAAPRDILHHIDLVQRFTEGMERQLFLDDVRTVYAVTRCLEIISEASRRLSENLKSQHPHIPNGWSWERVSSRLRRCRCTLCLGDASAQLTTLAARHPA